METKLAQLITTDRHLDYLDHNLLNGVSLHNLLHLRNDYRRRLDHGSPLHHSGLKVQLENLQFEYNSKHTPTIASSTESCHLLKLRGNNGLGFAEDIDQFSGSLCILGGEICKWSPFHTGTLVVATSTSLQEHQNKVPYPSSTDAMNVVFTVIREIIILESNVNIPKESNSKTYYNITYVLHIYKWERPKWKRKNQ